MKKKKQDRNQTERTEFPSVIACMNHSIMIFWVQVRRSHWDLSSLVLYYGENTRTRMQHSHKKLWRTLGDFSERNELQWDRWNSTQMWICNEQILSEQFLQSLLRLWAETIFKTRLGLRLPYTFRSAIFFEWNLQRKKEIIQKDEILPEKWQFCVLVTGRNYPVWLTYIALFSVFSDQFFHLRRTL